MAAENITPSPNQPVPAGDRTKKMKIWLLGTGVLVLLLIGGVYFYMTSDKTRIPVEQTSTNTPTQESLEDELNKVNVESIDKEFSQVDKDLQTL